jgi:hypothetical protein
MPLDSISLKAGIVMQDIKDVLYVKMKLSAATVAMTNP